MHAVLYSQLQARYTILLFEEMSPSFFLELSESKLSLKVIEKVSHLESARILIHV